MMKIRERVLFDGHRGWEHAGVGRLVFGHDYNRRHMRFVEVEIS